MSEADRTAPSAAMQAFQEKFRALQRDWQEQLPLRLQELRDGLDACRAAPGDEAALSELHRRLHTLAGSAGSFGMAALGQHARSLELGLEPLMDRGGRSAADFEATAQGLQQLLREAGSA